MSIISTKEMCRVTYDNGDYMKLMRQTYTCEPAFYYVTESHLPYDMSVDSSNNNLQVIIDYFKRRIDIEKKAIDNLPTNNIEVQKVHWHCLSVAQKFLKKLKSTPEEKSGSTETIPNTQKAQSVKKSD